MGDLQVRVVSPAGCRIGESARVSAAQREIPRANPCTFALLAPEITRCLYFGLWLSTTWGSLPAWGSTPPVAEIAFCSSPLWRNRILFIGHARRTKCDFATGRVDEQNAISATSFGGSAISPQEGWTNKTRFLPQVSGGHKFRGECDFCHRWGGATRGGWNRFQKIDPYSPESPRAALYSPYSPHRSLRILCKRFQKIPSRSPPDPTTVPPTEAPDSTGRA